MSPGQEAVAWWCRLVLRGLAASFAVVGSLFFFFPDGTIHALNAVGAALGRPVYEPQDPFCRGRKPDDRGASVDHFYTKLLKLAGTMQTAAGRREAERRTEFLRSFLAQLESEIGP